MQTIALVGLGAMGAAMADKWLATGFALRVFNRSRARAEPFAQKGARVCASPREAASGADLVIAMVADDEASRAAWLRADGALAGAKQGAVAIEMSTISPDWARALAKEAEAGGLQFLDAPVAGGPAAVTAAKLTIFVGGPAGALDKARPALETISARIEHLGPNGAGATWKLINYMMAGAQLASLAEALTLAAKAGVAPARAGALISQSVVASAVINAKLPRMIERRFSDPDAALRLAAKDQRYALDLAKALGVDVVLQPAIAEAFARAEKDGFGEGDVAAVFESVARRSGV